MYQWSAYYMIPMTSDVTGLEKTELKIFLIIFNESME